MAIFRELRDIELAVLTATGGAVAMAVALGTERFGGLVPCALCLVERWPYRIVVVLGVAAMLLRRPWSHRVLWAAVAVFAVAAGLGALHAGVEFGWWPSPLPECAAPRLASGGVARMLASMPAHPSKPCDDPTFLVPGLPVSMAALGGLYALVFALGLAISLWFKRERAPWTRRRA
ncbi:MAG: disulfide bond formation protein B [Janthinobacterium lividum]